MSSFITTIGGKRCTAIPRNSGAGASPSSISTTPTESPPPVETTAAAAPPLAAAPAIESTSEAPTSSTSTPSPLAAVAPTISTADVVPAETTAAVAASTSEVPPEAKPEATSETSAAAATSATPTTPLAAAIPDTDPSTTSASAISTSAVSSTPNTTSSAVAQSELRASDTQLTAALQKSTLSSVIPSPTTNATAPVESSASAGISLPTPKPRAGVMVGGIMGGVALVGIIFFLLWQYKKRRRRGSLLTPLTPPTANGSYEKYEIDNESVGPTARTKVWKARAGGFFGKVRNGFADTGASIKMKLGRDSTPSINMNRGNSQFIEAIPQHSRSNSTAMSASQIGHITARDRFGEWWTRFTEDVNFNWRLRNLVGKKSDPADTFRISEQRMTNSPNNPDFSSFLAMKDSELRDAANRRRDSLTASQSKLGSLNLDFSSSRADDPFADPSSKQQLTIPILKPGAEVVTLNPFVDPSSSVPAPKSTAKQTLQPSNYVAEIRRSRGQSVSNPAPASRLPSTLGGPTSRYPSTIRTNNSHDSFRSSTFSMNPRKKAGRSDPFDLDMLMLARPDLPTQLATAVPRNSGLSRISQSPTSSVGGVSGSMLDVAGGSANGMQPRVVSVQAGKARIVSEAETYSSKYSSGASALFSEWGDPGPDLGPRGLTRLKSHRAVGEGGSPTESSQGMTEDDKEVYELRRAGGGRNGDSVGRAM